jgi:hypothetical protein
LQLSRLALQQSARTLRQSFASAGATGHAAPISVAMASGRRRQRARVLGVVVVGPDAADSDIRTIAGVRRRRG